MQLGQYVYLVHCCPWAVQHTWTAEHVLSYPSSLLSWSRDGHKLVSASTDNIVSQWDVLSGDCDQRFRFPSPILKVQYHPRDQYV